MKELLGVTIRFCCSTYKQNQNKDSFRRLVPLSMSMHITLNSYYCRMKTDTFNLYFFNAIFLSCLCGFFATILEKLRVIFNFQGILPVTKI